MKRHGFRVIRQKGSHVRLRHEDGRVTTVPSHSGQDIGKGLLRKILRDTETFFKLIDISSLATGNTLHQKRQTAGIPAGIDYQVNNEKTNKEQEKQNVDTIYSKRSEKSTLQNFVG